MKKVIVIMLLSFIFTSWNSVPSMAAASITANVTKTNYTGTYKSGTTGVSIAIQGDHTQKHKTTGHVYTGMTRGSGSKSSISISRKVDSGYNYTKVKFGNYTEDLFHFAKIMFLTYERNPFNEKEPFTFEILRPYNENEIERREMFERIIFMQEYDKIFAWVKTLPNFGFDFYVELLRKIKVSSDNDVVDWLITKGVNLADMWEPTEHQKELMREDKFIDVTCEWTNVFIEFLEDEKTFGEHHWEYGKVIEFLNRPRYKEKVYDALDKALQIEQLENRQDLVDHLRTFSDIAETHFNKAKYKKWVIYPNNVKWMKSWAQEVETLCHSFRICGQSIRLVVKEAISSECGAEVDHEVMHRAVA